MMRSHWGQHDEDCYGCKLQSIRLSRGLHPISRKDRQWDRDMDAYSRLKRSGVQPQQIDGCANLEAKAQSEVEIRYGLAATDKGRKQAEQLVKDLG
jgi:hypothetical protein